MKFDYWHQRRYFRASGIDDDLPFGEPPFVLGPLVAIAEPIWQSMLATLAATCPNDEFPEWSWEEPLAGGALSVHAQRFEEVASEVAERGSIVVAPNIAEGLEPDAEVVVKGFRALSQLLRLAAGRGTSVQTWVE
jgi:hypothetical protein